MSGIEYRLPDVGEGLDRAEILSWKVRPGDSVTEDDVLAEIQTDKSVVEIPSPYTGVIESLGGDEGDTLAVGDVLAIINPEGEVAPSGSGAQRPEPSSQTPVGPAASVDHPPAESTDTRERPTPTDGDSAPGPTTASPDHGHRPVPASPSTRKRATDLGLDLRGVAGTGPGGRVTRDDVERAAARDQGSGRLQTPAERTGSRPAEDEVVPLRGLRREIARTMTEAQQTPAIYEWRDVPAARLLEGRRRLIEQHPDRRRALTLLPFVVKALVAALRAHPSFNARIDTEREEIVYRRSCHLGIATATDDGLIVPVVRDADQRSLIELGEEIARLAEAARDRRLSPDEVRDGTCTISNYGSFGTRIGAPLIRPPEVAILGLGRAHEQVVAENGQPVVKMMLPISVGADHRLNDGDGLAAFCDTLSAHLEEPTLLLAGGL